jgi:hypothetical protein
MNGPVNSSPIPPACPSTAADPAHGQRPACLAEFGRLGLVFQRMLRDRTDARPEPEPEPEPESGKYAAVLAPGSASKIDAGFEAPSPCDLRGFVGERRLEGNPERHEGFACDGGQRHPAPLEPMPADTACTRVPDASPLLPRIGRPAATGRLDDGNDAPYRPELAVRWLVTPNTTGPAAWTGNPAPDPRELGATRAALAASLMNPVSTTESRAGAAWEVSLPLAPGAGIELHATRPQTPAGAGAWILGIRTGARDLTSALARTAPRLSERLEVRSVPAHVRIERDDRKGEP